MRCLPPRIVCSTQNCKDSTTFKRKIDSIELIKKKKRKKQKKKKSTNTISPNITTHLYCREGVEVVENFNLTSLDISHNTIGPEAAEAVYVTHSYPPSLFSLALSHILTSYFPLVLALTHMQKDLSGGGPNNQDTEDEECGISRKRNSGNRSLQKKNSSFRFLKISR